MSRKTARKVVIAVVKDKKTTKENMTYLCGGGDTVCEKIILLMNDVFKLNKTEAVLVVNVENAFFIFKLSSLVVKVRSWVHQLWWTKLMKTSPKLEYFGKLTKTALIVKPTFEDNAK